MAVQLRHIQKSYRSPVIKDISYCFEAGKLYVIKGVSGCGKTTLLNIIGGVDRDFTGEVISDSGGPVSAGYVFQSSLLLSRATVWENLLLIKNDPETVWHHSAHLGVSDLLGKYPEQLSGGERQRVAIVRALLQDTEVLLADEPTASLDDRNSQIIAEALAQLKTQGKIVLVATHEHYFDDLADEILYLQYGEITKTLTQSPPAPALESSSPPMPGEKPKFRLTRLIKKRNQKRLRLTGLLPLALVFVLVLGVSTVQNCFRSEYFRYVARKYPMDYLALPRDDWENFPFRERVRLYDFYTATEGDVTAYYLLDKKDSVLGIDGMIAEGYFPEKDTEILVSRDFLTAFFGNAGEAYTSYLGKTVPFLGKGYQISGILADFSDEDFQNNLEADVYYRHNVKDISIFIPYAAISAFGEVLPSPYLAGVCDGLLSSPQIQAAVRGAPSVFYQNIQESQYTVNVITGLFTGILLLLYIVGCIFIVTIIQTELFYRRKELGYLQIFGMNRKRVASFVAMEYRIRGAASLLLGTALYCVGIGIYWGVTRSFVFCQPVYSVLVLSALLGIYLLSVHITLKRFLKRSILSLIR